MRFSAVSASAGPIPSGPRPYRAPGGVPEKLGSVGWGILGCWSDRTSHLAPVAVGQGLNRRKLRFRGVMHSDGGIIMVRVGPPSRSCSKYWRSGDSRPLAPTHGARSKNFDMPGWSEECSGVPGEGTRRFGRTAEGSRDVGVGGRKLRLQSQSVWGRIQT